MTAQKTDIIRLAQVSVALLLSACGSPNRSEFRQSLNLEQSVAEKFVSLIQDNGHAEGPILVITNPSLGQRGVQAESTRLRGLQKGLGSGVTQLRIVPAGAELDPEVQFIMNDYLPLSLLQSLISEHPDITAIVSLVGFPYMDRPLPGMPPLYVFGVNRQELAIEAIQEGWAHAVLYSRGSDDQPRSTATTRIPVELMESYAMEVR